VTEKLYYQDPHMLAFDARTIAVAAGDGHWEVELDRTCFYPGGGGQPSDRGSLGGVPVVDVIAREDHIVHLLERPVDPGALHGEVDGGRRRDFMAQHTGQHVFSQALLRAGALETVSVHFGDDETTIELKAASAEDAVLRAAEDIANGIIMENRPVILHETDRDGVKSFPLRRTPPDAGRLRIVEVRDFEFAACGGIHVTSTGEIFMVKVTSAERIRGRVRLHLMIGRRAFADYGRKIALLQDITRELTCGEAVVRGRVHELLVREKESARELRRLHIGQANADADDSVSAARGIGSALFVRRIFASAGPDYLKAFAERVVASPGRICVAMDQGETGFQWIVAHSLGAGVELAAFMPGLYDIAGAKGGGRGERMQGMGSSPEAITLFADAIEGEMTRVLQRSMP
jgi:alanyl-tRNA synthetase